MSDSLPRTGWREAWALALIAVCIVLLLSLFSYDWHDIGALAVPTNAPPVNFIGPFGAWTAFLLLLGFGFAAYFLPVWFLGFGLTLVFRGIRHIRAKLAWAAVFMAGLCGLLAIEPSFWRPLFPLLNVDAPGGVPAQRITDWLIQCVLGRVGTLILDLTVIGVAVILFFGWDALRTGAIRLALAIEHALETWRTDRAERHAENAYRRAAATGRSEAALLPDPPAATPPRAATREKADVPTPEPAPETPAEAAPAKLRRPSAPKPTPAPPPPPPATGGTINGAPYQLPPLDLLSPTAPGSPQIAGDSEAAGRAIVGTLSDFGIRVEITGIEHGPTVTRFEMVPAAGVRLERISALAPNLQLNLKAASVRVQAPIPGKGTVGIEVPNAAAAGVCLHEMLTGPDWRPDLLELPLALGKDVGGKDLIVDLARMPHILIAGATGSGKTVCMNSILAGLLMARPPDELHLMLIDPKIVEFAAYAGLPHLEGVRKEVITDPKKVAGGLRWAITEMERRYRLFSKSGVRHIKAFNTRTIESQQTLFGGDEPAGGAPVRLPYIVIIVDELADLMLTAAAEVETYIARLAQMSRATGIHMILATQRPSVNVITGTIKANFPARIAFQVAQKVDSRTILDTIGAEKLLGRGDMLYQPPGASKLVRAQGALTTDDEIARLTDFIRRQCPPPEIPEAEEAAPAEGPEAEEGTVDAAAANGAVGAPGAPPFSAGAAPQRRPAPGAPPAATYDDMLATGGGGDEDETLIQQSVAIIRETRRASTSMLQRRLRIGYTRAARVMDVLEERGVVGPARGSDPREILMDLDGDMTQNGAGGAAARENADA